MALSWGDTVPRDLYDRALDHIQRLEVQIAAMTKDVIDIKRHDLGMVPKDFDPTTADPMKSLGPKTQLAIEEFCAGDPELRRFLIGRAVVETASARADDMDEADADLAVATKITHGDR